MKRAELGQMFLWMGKLTAVTSINPGEKAINFTTKDTGNCPHCGKPVDENWSVIEGSPMFQQNAEPVKTISE